MNSTSIIKSRFFSGVWILFAFGFMLSAMHYSSIGERFSLGLMVGLGIGCALMALSREQYRRLYIESARIIEAWQKMNDEIEARNTAGTQEEKPQEEEKKVILNV